MQNSKKELNPKLDVGDRIMCLHMEGEFSVPMGTTGIVQKISKDPFEQNEQIIMVEWDNGSTLNLLSVTDKWIKVPRENIEEQFETSQYDFFSKNSEVFDNFDWRFLREFLKKLRDSAAVNMFHSEPFLYSGKEWINRYYGENQEDNEDFQEVLNMADKAKNEMILGVLKYMETKGIEIELNKVNNLVRNFAKKILQLYISFF